MDKRQIASLLALRELGLNASMSTFDNRLLVQKAIYLAQEAGSNLGYYYSWYLRGPYCSDVADDFFAARSDPQGVRGALQNWVLDAKSLSGLPKLRGLIEERKKHLRDERHLSRALELLASVHYVITRQKVKNNAPETVKAKLDSYNKNFSKSEIANALSDLHRVGLLK